MNFPASELLQRCGAKICVEAFAIDRDRLEFGEVRAGGNFVVLITFVPLELAQLYTLRIALQEIRRRHPRPSPQLESRERRVR